MVNECPALSHLSCWGEGGGDSDAIPGNNSLRRWHVDKRFESTSAQIEHIPEQSWSSQPIRRRNLLKFGPGPANVGQGSSLWPQLGGGRPFLTVWPAGAWRLLRDESRNQCSRNVGVVSERLFRVSSLAQSDFEYCSMISSPPRVPSPRVIWEFILECQE